MNPPRLPSTAFVEVLGKASSGGFELLFSVFCLILLSGSTAFGEAKDATTPSTTPPTAPSTAPATETPAEPVESTTSMAASNRALAPPPIGVRFGEPLEGQRFRVSYQYERIQKQGLLVSDSHITPAELFGNVLPSPPYTQSPRSLTITAHTFQLAYSPHPRITLVVEVPFLMKELDTRTDTGATFESQTEGVGDIGFALVVPFIRKGNESSHVHVGLNVPTGSVRRGGNATRLPFDSQLGNGTVDLEWGWTYRGHVNPFAWGGQLLGRHPVGRNDLDYREGSRFEASFWGAVELISGVSTSLRVGWEKRNNIRFRRPVSNATVLDPSDNGKARGGTRLTISPGLSFEIPALDHQRIAIEVGIPFYQDLDGPQLEQDWSVKAGWQWEF